MKTIADYLSWPMTEDIDAVLTNLSWENKFELSVVLGQRALEEKQGKESWDRIQVQDSIAIGASGPIEPPEKTNEPPT
jgi:hypothetical protein